ncbi:uncharacterized protein LOC128220735 [Mya arenaria]|uniref:uncharacterized protein LOC128220735 n=1 Tax=Mya arenaria TaxID=6604 RepID=UPI0022E3A126|nr:uncharacterized protein LOC128220735 [Mya arenaria]
MISINNIDDIRKLGLKDNRALAEQWGVNIKGAKNLQEIHNILIEHWIKIIKINGGGRPSDHGIIKASRDQAGVRNKLCEKFQKTEILISKFPKKLRLNMKRSHPSLEHDFKDRGELLKKGECCVLVAGEVGAGKSSIINLLLEKSLLPVDALKCTNTFVEIRKCDRKEAVCFNKNGGKTVISLSDDRGIQEFHQTIRLSDDNDDNPYEHIEVYYPLESLSEGIVIVDMPGIEGGSNVDQRLDKYLHSAFGFLYVINTNTAGGVQQSRLGHLLKTVVNSCDEFSPKSSLFIGNKWENVPDKDKKDVQEDVFKKLTAVYPGVRQHQLHYMSVNQAREVHERHKCHTEQHTELLKKMEQLIPNSLRQGLSNHYWWLASFLTRASYILRVTGVQQELSGDELKTKYDQMQKHVQELQSNSKDCMGRLNDKVEFEIFKINNLIKEKMCDRKTQNMLCEWDELECAGVEKRWKQTADTAAVKISERIARVMDGWQRENNILKHIDQEIINVFANEFGLLRHQVQDIEKFLTDSNHTNPMMKTIKVVPVKGIFSKKKGKMERTYNTLGGAISCIGMLDTGDKRVKKLFKDRYKDGNKTQGMAEATTLYLQSILEQKDIGIKLKKYFSRYFKEVDEAAKRLPVFLESDKQLIETLRNSMQELKEMQQVLPTLNMECTELHGTLDIFYINEIMEFDFDIQELDWDNKVPLGRGSFAEVYKSELKRKRQPVAVKVSIETVRKSNISEILLEDRTMRDLKHPNVVRYYGASNLKNDKGLKWIMVMELCADTLKGYYCSDSIDREKRIPGLIPNDHPRKKDAVNGMLLHALDICKGLEYIHEKGYTHRDMKLENVLIANDNTAKITDVGVAKATNILVRTCNGSPAYMAPEVLLSTKNQSNKIDIYSTSLVLWEMWFGKEITDDMNHEILGAGFQGDAMSRLKERQGHPRGGWRPSFRSPNRPPSDVAEIITRGWDNDPDKRPSGKEMRIFFEKKCTVEYCSRGISSIRLQ